MIPDLISLINIQHLIQSMQHTHTHAHLVSEPRTARLKGGGDCDVLHWMRASRVMAL
jgi:hypothetical protein